MKTISILYFILLIYLILVAYLAFYDPSSPFYEFIDSTFNSEKIMNIINRNKNYYYLISGIVGAILVGLYFTKGEMLEGIIPGLMLLYVSSILYMGLYNPDNAFYQFMNKVFNTQTIPNWTEDNKGLYQFIAIFTGFILAISIYFVRKRATLNVNESSGDNSLIGFLSKIIGVVGFFGLIVLFIYGLEYFVTTVSSSTIISLIIIALLFFVIIALLVSVFYKKPTNLNIHDNSIIGLLKNCALLIPCLLIDLVDYMKYEYSITTRSSTILFITMSIIIAMYFIKPYISSYLYDIKGTQLIEQPIYTNVYTSLGSFEELSGIITKNNETTYDYRYSLSFWFYVNPQTPATNGNYSKYTSILNYGNKPNILYKADDNKVMIKMTQGHNKEVKIFVDQKLPLQKWNHFVVNYDGGTLDVFLNNELVGSKIKVVPYMTHDVITSGEVNGIYGGLCNVKYFGRTLLKHDINKLYSSLKSKNPPLI